MKINNYKSLEKVAHKLNTKVWRAIYKGYSEWEEAKDFFGFSVRGNKMYLLFKGYHPDLALVATYNQEEDYMEHCISVKIWKPILVSFGYIPKDKFGLEF